MEDEYDFIFKVLLLGNSDVGKNSLIIRFVDEIWSENCVPTIGVDFRVKTLEIDKKRIKMQIWDTAGQERFRTVISSYFRGSHGILLIYDITNRDSFKNLENYLIDIEISCGQNFPKILIGNNCDLVDDREVSFEEGQQFANRNGMKFIETSPKMNINVYEAFETLAKLMMEFTYEKTVNNKNPIKKLNSTSGNKLKNKKCYK